MTLRLLEGKGKGATIPLDGCSELASKQEWYDMLERIKCIIMRAV